MIKRGGRKNIICQKISETLCEKCICDCIIVPYINVCNPNHPWRIWSKLVLLYFTCHLCIKVFSQKTQDAKMAIISPNGGVNFVKRSISSRKLQATLKY
jgi:hypothetical protein